MNSFGIISSSCAIKFQSLSGESEGGDGDRQSFINVNNAAVHPGEYSIFYVVTNIYDLSN